MAAQDAVNLEHAIEAHKVPKGNSTRRDMAVIVEEMLKNANKGLEHLHLRLSGPKITMTMHEFKSMGHTVTCWAIPLM